MDASGSGPLSQNHHSKHDSGFTLLETLVAMTVLAITLTSIMQTYVSGKKFGHVTDQYVHALILSQSLMAETLADKKYYLKSRSGQYGLLKWRIDVVPGNSVQGRPLNNTRWQLFNVDVTIGWPPERKIHLKTIKMGRIDG